jgi:hypothetical protein
MISSVVESSCRGSKSFLFPNRPVPFTETLAPRQNRQTVDGTVLFGEDEMCTAECHPERISYCKGLCKSCYQKQWRAGDIERIRSQERVHRNNNKEKINAYVREWKSEHKDSVKVGHKKYRENNADTLLSKHREYNSNNREKINLNNRIYNYTHPDSKMSTHLTNRYKITKTEYDNMFSLQNGVCAICGNTGGKKRLCVDHNHITGKIRGLLCDGCNVGIGRLKDSVSLVEKALDYLKLHEDNDD